MTRIDKLEALAVSDPSQEQFSEQFSALEVGIAAFYVACWFLVAVIFCHVVFGETALQRTLVVLTGGLALAALARVWLRQKRTRRHPVNLLLIAAACFVTFDLVV